jgi:hypothetical protein
MTTISTPPHAGGVGDLPHVFNRAGRIVPARRKIAQDARRLILIAALLVTLAVAGFAVASALPRQHSLSPIHVCSELCHR